MAASTLVVAGKYAYTAAKYLTGYATVVSGVAIAGDLASAAARKVAPQQEPVVSGAADFFSSLLDPADVFGYRKKKEDKLKAQIQAGKASAKEQEAAKKAAYKKVKEASKKAAKAEKLAAENGKKAAALEAEGKVKEAEAVRRLEEAQKRLAEVTRQLAEKSAEAAAGQNIAKALDVAQKAVETGKQATNPYMSTVQAMAAAPTDGAKSLMGDVYDSVHRAAEPDYEGLVSRIMQGDSGAFMELGDIEGVVSGVDWASPVERCQFCDVAISGPCCASCAFGRPCEGVAGDDDDDDDDAVSGGCGCTLAGFDMDDDVSGDDDDEVAGDDDDEVAGFGGTAFDTTVSDPQMVLLSGDDDDDDDDFAFPLAGEDDDAVSGDEDDAVDYVLDDLGDW